jgi:hypothetical protein
MKLEFVTNSRYKEILDSLGPRVTYVEVISDERPDEKFHGIQDQNTQTIYLIEAFKDKLGAIKGLEVEGCESSLQ